ncbi:hypothetical protein WR25_05516 [Diploscapter pachys]|uniref:Uncharacterized protein n=1 Tax=Diploscapter pachys TaxID=2018661 RepID=A0A2A2M279_9BILA|nr:hypothetical protein WR25_05516 [Diploscapter pachys]
MSSDCPAAGALIERGDTRQQLVDLPHAHARRHQRVDARIEGGTVDQGDAAHPHSGQRPAVRVRGRGLGDLRGSIGPCERTALQLAAALFQLQLLQVLLLLLLLAQHFLAGHERLGTHVAQGQASQYDTQRYATAINSRQMRLGPRITDKINVPCYLCPTAPVQFCPELQTAIPGCCLRQRPCPGTVCPPTQGR